jgi:hypothetical protein
MKQTTKVTLLIIVAIIFILVLGLFALARFFGKQLIQPCMQEGYTDSEIDADLTKLKDPATIHSIIQNNYETTGINGVPIYAKSGVVSRIVLNGTGKMLLRKLKLSSPNKIYRINKDYEISGMNYVSTWNPKTPKAARNAYYSFKDIITITMKIPSQITSILIENSVDGREDYIKKYTMNAYNTAGSILFSQKLNHYTLTHYEKSDSWEDPPMSDDKYEFYKNYNTVVYLISPFGYVSLVVDKVPVNTLPIIDVKIADNKRIYIIQHNGNIWKELHGKTFMLSDTGELAIYNGIITDFTEDRWKNARKIPIPDKYSITSTIFPNAVLPALRPATTTAATTRPATTTSATTTSATTTSATTGSKLDSYLDFLIDYSKRPGAKEYLAELETLSKWSEKLVPVYTKPGLISRIVLKGNNWLHFRDISLMNGYNVRYKANTDYTMDVTGSPKFFSETTTFSQMGDTVDSLFHSGTKDNVVFTITMKTPSVINLIGIANRFDCCWEKLNSFTMYGYSADGTELFSKKLDDPALSNFKEGTKENYEANRSKNTAFYLMSPFGYVSLFANWIRVNKVPIMDVKIADYKRIYITEYYIRDIQQTTTWMMSERYEIATYSGSISNFTEDQWKNARKLTIPHGYSIKRDIFPGVVLPSVPTTAPPTTTPVRTSAAATTPAPTTTRPPVPTTTTPVPTIAATTLAPSTITPAPTIAATTPAMTTKAVATTTPVRTPAPVIITPAPTTTPVASAPTITTVASSSAIYSTAYNTEKNNL